MRAGEPQIRERKEKETGVFVPCSLYMGSPQPGCFPGLKVTSSLTLCFSSRLLILGSSNRSFPFSPSALGRVEAPLYLALGFYTILMVSLCPAYATISSPSWDHPHVSVLPFPVRLLSDANCKCFSQLVLLLVPSYLSSFSLACKPVFLWSLLSRRLKSFKTNN